MDRLSILKDAISEELFKKEPLAMAIMLHLQNEDPFAYSRIISKFDEIVSVRVDQLIEKYTDDSNQYSKPQRKDPSEL